MSYLTLNIAMQGLGALVAGGGAVALRKTRVLHAAGARVRVVAPAVAPELLALHKAGEIELRRGEYQASDLDGVILAVAATDDAEVNRQVAADAHAKRLLVCISDHPESGNCTFPALLRRGGLQIAVSTGGRSPAFAAEVRDRIAAVIGDEYGSALEQRAAEREKLLTEGSGATYNKRLLRSDAQRLIAELSERKDMP